MTRTSTKNRLVENMLENLRGLDRPEPFKTRFDVQVRKEAWIIERLTSQTKNLFVWLAGGHGSMLQRTHWLIADRENRDRGGSTRGPVIRIMARLCNMHQPVSPQRLNVM
jgi:hypothetical protein